MLEEIIGNVVGHRDGHGFVVRDDGQPDIYLPPNEMRAVLHGDQVRARVIRFDRKGRPEGKVNEIVSRSEGPIIGRLVFESNMWMVAPEDKRYGQDVLIHKTGLGQAQAGQIVVVMLTEPPALYGQPVGRITEVLGDIDDPGMEIEIAVRKYGVPHLFSEAAIAQARSLPDTVQASDTKGRVDLRDTALVTIDGEDARDFDDAVYCEPAKIGRSKGWRLLVAIADVSHYVQTGAAIDKDAYDRATSVYFPRRVIPMLPEKLSNGLCSLNPLVDRLCMVCDMLITASGDVHAYQFYPAVMNSHARFTYTEVADILINTRGPAAKQRGDLVERLMCLQDVYRALLQQRQKRGAIDLETTETQIISDDMGRIARIEPRTRNEAHRLIEEAMLAANVCAAEFIQSNKHLGLYRVHKGPTPERLETLRQYLKALGIQVNVPHEAQPSDLQAISHATQDRSDATQVHTMLLRSMQQAVYAPENEGHFGLAYGAYTHFTSPIRRYPDLLVHRVIKGILSEKGYALPDLPMPSKDELRFIKRYKPQPGGQVDKPKTKKRVNKTQLSWEAAGLHCSANERRADEASRDVEAWLKCKYMKDRLGEVYQGTITSVTSFGFFVTLDALYVEGLVHISELRSDYYRYDEARQELRGERLGLRYGLGTKLKVQVSRVDLDGRRIDFRLDEAPAAERVAAKAGKAPDEPGVSKRAGVKSSTSRSGKSVKAAKPASTPRAARKAKR